MENRENREHCNNIYPINNHNNHNSNKKDLVNELDRNWDELNNKITKDFISRDHHLNNINASKNNLNFHYNKINSSPIITSRNQNLTQQENYEDFNLNNNNNGKIIFYITIY
jgi:hypothetical protein